MKRLVILVFGLILAVTVVQSGAQPPATKPGAKKTPATKPVVTDPAAAKAPAATDPPAAKPSVIKPESGQDGESSVELAAIRQAAEDFATAFNKGDASAVAAHWTENGEYISETGVVFSGRKAIEDEYKNFFAANPGLHMGIVIDALRLLSDSAAIEDGHITLNQGHATTAVSTRYTAVHVKMDGKWLMSSVRDTHIDVPLSSRNMADLEFLIGSWVAEEQGSRNESVCTWVANKSFVQRNYTVTHHDQSTSSGIQLIGYNPQGGYIQSWNFSSDGGYAVGIWSPVENGWAAEIQGTRADGQTTTATNLLNRLDDNAYAWKSIRRIMSSESLPDSDEVIYKRQSK